MKKAAERNLDWMCLPIPEDCKSIYVGMDGELFDEFVKVGLVPLSDPRTVKHFDFNLPVFIGYEPGVDPANPKGLDIAARLRAAKQDVVPTADRHGHADVQVPSQELDSGNSVFVAVVDVLNGSKHISHPLSTAKILPYQRGGGNSKIKPRQVVPTPDGEQQDRITQNQPCIFIIPEVQGGIKEEIMPRMMTAQTPTDEDILAYNNVPVDVAAKYIGWSSCNVYRALQQERAPFGMAVQTSETTWTYNISPGLLVKYKSGELQAYRLNEVIKLAADGVERIIDSRMEAVAALVKGPQPARRRAC